MNIENVLTGAWRLLEFEFQRDDGRIIHPFGRSAQGSILYTASGRYSAQLMSCNRPRFAIPDQMQGTPAEIEANFKGCISYFGSYEIDTAQSLVIHHVEGSIFPNMEGTKQTRLFEITGTRLTLKTPSFKLDGEPALGILVWERLT